MGRRFLWAEFYEYKRRICGGIPVSKGQKMYITEALPMATYSRFKCPACHGFMVAHNGGSDGEPHFEHGQGENTTGCTGWWPEGGWPEEEY
jgi:hypothetical protein